MKRYDFRCNIFSHQRIFGNTHLAYLHDQSKSGLFRRLAFSSQLEQFKKYSKSSNWLEKAGPP